MKIFFLQLFIFLFSISNFNYFTQTHSNDTSKKEIFIPVEIVHIEEFPFGNDSLDSIQRVNQIYEIIEVMPEFPGGQSELYEFLSKNIHYPKECKKEKIQGKVYVRFVILKDGTISDITVIKGAHQLLNEEAIRVISIMPNWIPGTKKGVTVNVYFTLPINFQIN